MQQFLKNTALTLIFVQCLSLTSAPFAYAQQSVESLLRSEKSDFDERVGVRNVPEEYNAYGFNYKGFQIRPEMLTELQYNDNVFAEEDGGESDLIMSLRPTVTISKSYDVLELATRMRANIERFKEFDGDDKEEFTTEFGGKYEPNLKWNVPFNLRYNKSARARGNPQNATALDEPTNIEETSATIGIERNFNRLSVRLLGKYGNFDFEDGTTQNGATPVIFSDNNRSTHGANLRFSYLFPRNSTGKSGHLVFLDLDLQEQQFEKNSFQNGAFTTFKRDNTTYNAIAGFTTTYKGLLEASLGVGYLSRDYEAAQLDTLNSMDFIGEVKYSLTPKIALDLQADRSFTQSSDTQTGIVETEYSIGSDYEIYHNLFWRSNFAYKNFEFSDIDREDDDYRFSTNLRYFINNNFYTQLGYSYQDRSSTVTDRSFDRSVISLSLNSKL